MHEILQKLTAALESEPDIAFAYLFGSVAKGRSGPLSDVDVAVYFHPVENAQSRFNRRLQLMSKLGKALQRDDVDVVPLDEAPLDLAHAVVESGKLVFSRDDKLRNGFVFKVVRDYLDAEPLRQMEWQALEKFFNSENDGNQPRRYSRSFKKAARNAGRAKRNSLARQ